ncbi:MAG: polymer-forming cytoskeletal protein [Phycisphaerae bacterium]
MSQGPATRIVRCCHCQGMMRVAARALSVFCPHCQKRVTLESLKIVGSHPGRMLATCGDILVEPSSQLNLEIMANRVVVRGRVRGSVSANESIEVSATGRIIGDVRAPKIIVHDGGVIQGRCVITAGAPTTPRPSALAGEPPKPAVDPAPSLPSPPTQPAMPSPPVQIRPVRLD